MRILMVSSEAAPYAKAGGLADVVAALAVQLSTLGHDVRLVLPRYYSINPAASNYLRHMEPLGVPLGDREEWTAVFETKLNGNGPTVYFLDHERLFGRDGIYGTRSEPDYTDNVERFALLCRGAFQICRMFGWTPEVVHAHDWPAALAMVYLKTLEKYTEFAGARGVFTIHNVGYQGIYPKERMKAIGLPWDYYTSAGFEYFDQLNLLKAGIFNADVVTTVSPTYAKEIRTPTLGYNLEGVLASRGDRVWGILNGIDYDEWNPEKDPFLPRTFSADDLSGKAETKRRLQIETGLPADPAKPLFGMVGRLVEQKGYRELCEPGFGVLPRLLREQNLQLIILGTGAPWIEGELAKLAWKHPNLKVILQFNEGLAHRIEGGADFFLMPSLYEPCGLNQMYSLRYGTVPIVTRTGGLADTVQDFDETTGRGTGFLIDPPTPRGIYDAVALACAVFREKPEVVRSMRRAGMEKRFTWEAAAHAYETAYRGT